LISSLSNYELGRRFWHQQDYQRSLEAVEQSIAAKLFPYTVGIIWLENPKHILWHIWITHHFDPVK